MSTMWEKLEQIDRRYQEIEEEMVQPEVIADPKKIQYFAQQRANIEEVVSKYREFKTKTKELETTREMLNEDLEKEMQSLIKQEIEKLSSKQEGLLKELKVSLLSKDPNDDKEIIMEIRAGAGGEEAGLFAAELFRMYSRYAQSKGWGVEIISSSESGIGGFKEIVFEINGRGAYSKLKYERGVHRVQRIPLTESSGRIHTSTVTVAVLPKAEEVDVDINQDDLRIDIYHSGGAGGQNVNKVATAVRITHLPTGMVVTCQDERSQLRNRQKAMAVLRARMLDIERRKQEDAVIQDRRSQVGTGERAEKIRTYNFPQDRVTDHRYGLTFHNLPKIMAGDLDDIIEGVSTTDQANQLEEQAA
jgi:peptide chain release factor 1